MWIIVMWLKSLAQTIFSWHIQFFFVSVGLLKLVVILFSELRCLLHEKYLSIYFIKMCPLLYYLGTVLSLVSKILPNKS